MIITIIIKLGDEFQWYEINNANLYYKALRILAEKGIKKMALANISLPIPYSSFLFVHLFRTGHVIHFETW